MTSLKIISKSGYLPVAFLSQTFTWGECMEPCMSILFRCTALISAMNFIPFAFAQETSPSTKPLFILDTLVVTATRSEEKISAVPARINIIEPQILAQSPIAELSHLLMNEASINMVQSGGYGQQASLFTRGTNSTHTLVLRDGVRLNGVSAGLTPLAFLDTTDIKQVEILKGPASVLYGTDAIGGVVQLISKTPEKTSAFITGEIGENNTYKSVLGADFADNGIYAQVRGQRLETDGTVVTNAPNLEDADYDQKGFSAKFGVEKELFASSVDYSQNSGNSTYDNYGMLIHQDFKNENINLKGRVNLSEDLAIHARLSQFKDETDQTDSMDFVHNTTQEAELYSHWQFSPSQNLLTGISHRNLEADVLAISEWSTVDYQEDTNSTGYFLQHQYQTDKINTQLGVRVEDHEKFGTHTVGQIAARYFIEPQTSVYSNIGTAFRAPTANDLYAVNWGANPDLKPEKSFSYEIGLDHQLTEQLSIGISAYRNEVSDLITFTDKLNNVDQANFTGGELNLNWQQDELFLNFAYAYVQAKNDATKQDLTRRPHHSATLSAGWQDEQFGVSTSVSAKSSSKDFADWPSTTLNTNAGYVTADVNAYWKIHPQLKAFTNIQNIADTQYKTAYNGAGVYYINGGRLASLGLTLQY